VTDQDASTPKVTPFLLRAADTMCPRRLASEHSGEPGTADPMNRARVRNVLLDAIRTWHETGSWPEPVGLVTEERAVVTHATRWYERRFPEPVATVTLPVESPTELPRRQVLLGGWVDLGVEHLDGRRELRQLAWQGRPGPVDPLDLPALRLAVLRLACLDWLGDGLEVSWTDLLSGETRRARVTPADLTDLGAWLDERLAVVARRSDPDAPAPGRDCATCRFVPRCPAHGVKASMFTKRDGLVAAMLALSPTGLESWHRCPREWRDRTLLHLPPSDQADGAAHGLLLHRLLNLVHRTGSCQDDDHVQEVLLAHGADLRTAEEVRRHATRCPVGAEAVGHEVEWARAHPGPPVFLATARLDAVWDHDGVLDVRDYKSGRVGELPVADDRRARLQAWVAAPAAAARGLRLRLRYEHLATEVVEDPEPWEPTAEDLVSVEEELVADVNAMLAERVFAGVADADVCGRCRYRSICDDSAAPGVPSWPAPDALEHAQAQPV
jgi:PD-(D/E)XK nuclease superfamily